MLALKDYQLSVNLESISFQIKKENVDTCTRSLKIILKTKILQVFKKGKLTEAFVVSSETSKT